MPDILNNFKVLNNKKYIIKIIIELIILKQKKIFCKFSSGFLLSKIFRTFRSKSKKRFIIFKQTPYNKKVVYAG